MTLPFFIFIKREKGEDMSVNELQEALLKAVDTITAKKVESLELDKTVTGVVDSCVNTASDKYRVEYNGGIMFAYARPGEIYLPKSVVQVQIPKNDFSQKKWILGYASEDREAIQAVASAQLKNNYEKVGKNIVSIEPVNKMISIPSSKESFLEVLYSKQQDDNEKAQNKIQIDNKSLKTYLQEGNALKFQATFLTDLSNKVKKTVTGHYGVILNLAFKEGYGSYQTYDEEIEKLGHRITCQYVDDNDSAATISLAHIKRDLDKILCNLSNKSDVDLLEELKTKKIPEKINKLNSAYKDALGEKHLQEALASFTHQANMLLSSLNEKSDITDEEAEEEAKTKIASYKRWRKEKPSTNEKIKVVSYTLDSNNMEGAPFFFEKGSEQYLIFSIEEHQRFEYIDSMIFYSEGFPKEDSEKEDSKKEDSEKNKIFIKDINIQVLKPLQFTSGNYSLHLDFPDGKIFKKKDEATQEQEIKVSANMLYKRVQKVNNPAFVWGVQDTNVVSEDSQGYNSRLGTGWKCLFATTSFKEESSNDLQKEEEISLSDIQCKIKEIDNSSYKNLYKCVGYNELEQINIPAFFTIINENAEYRANLISNLGNEFSFDSGEPTLIMDVKSNKNPNINTKSTKKLSYLWSRKNALGEITIFDKTKEELEQELDNLIKAEDSEKKENFNKRQMCRRKIEEISELTFEENTLKCPIHKIPAGKDAFVTFICTCYEEDSSAEENTLTEKKIVAIEEITLVNKKTVARKDYSPYIVGGGQLFEYSTEGISPTHESNREPQSIMPLEVVLYNPDGFEVEKDAYEVSWVYPNEETLILPDSNINSLETDPVTGKEKVLLSQSICPFRITDIFNESYKNNQIICRVRFEDRIFEQKTEFLFSKKGGQTVNGNDIFIKTKEDKQVSPVQVFAVESEEIPSLIEDAKSVDCCVIWTTPKTELSNDATDNIYSPPGENKEIKLKSIIYEKGIARDLDPKMISYKIASPDEKSDLLEIKDNKIFSKDNIVLSTLENSKDCNSLIMTTVKYNDKSYYYVHPVYHIFKKDETIKIKIGYEKTLKQVLYGTDGFHPVYNDKQGIELFIETDNHNEGLEYKIICRGGYKTTDDSIFSAQETVTEFLDEECTARRVFIPLRVKDFYDGEAQNNHLEVKIFATENKKLLATCFIPVYVGIDNYNLQSLDAWNGNTIQLNGDACLLTPQTGMGLNTQDSKGFTGVVLGTERQKPKKATITKTESEDNEGATATEIEREDKIGLLGYHRGERSIFLDAKTGTAVFGLPETSELDESDKNPRYSEGQIVLAPNGTSKIGSWRIGSRFLYSSFKDENFKYTGGVSLHPPLSKTQPEKLTPCELEAPYNNQYLRSIGSDKTGVLLSSDPSYLSIKGKRWSHYNDKNKDFKFYKANSAIREEDSLELELNPNQYSLFNIYRHTQEPPVEAVCYLTVRRNVIDKKEKFYLDIRQVIFTEENGEISAKRQLLSSISFTALRNNIQLEQELMKADWRKLSYTPFKGIGAYGNGEWYKEKWCWAINKSLELKSGKGIYAYAVRVKQDSKDVLSNGIDINLKKFLDNVENTYNKASNHIPSSDEMVKIREQAQRLFSIKTFTKNGSEPTDVKFYIYPIIELSDFPFEFADDWPTDIPFKKGGFSPHWIRESKIGIDSQGRFFSSALRDQIATVTPGKIAAQGKEAIQEEYIGVNIEVSEKENRKKTHSLLKVYMKPYNILEELTEGEPKRWDETNHYRNGTVYISTTDESSITNDPKTSMNEYQKPIQVMAKRMDTKTTEGISLQAEKTSLDLSVKEGIFLQTEKTSLDLLAKESSCKLNFPNSTGTFSIGETYSHKIEKEQNVIRLFSQSSKKKTSESVLVSNTNGLQVNNSNKITLKSATKTKDDKENATSYSITPGTLAIDLTGDSLPITKDGATIRPGAVDIKAASVGLSGMMRIGVGNFNNNFAGTKDKEKNILYKDSKNNFNKDLKLVVGGNALLSGSLQAKDYQLGEAIVIPTDTGYDSKLKTSSIVEHIKNLYRYCKMIEDSWGFGAGLSPDEMLAVSEFRNHGLDKPQIAAILGNMRQESGGEIGDPIGWGTVESGGGGGIGAWQWTGGRNTALQNFINKYKKDFGPSRSKNRPWAVPYGQIAKLCGETLGHFWTKPGGAAGGGKRETHPYAWQWTEGYCKYDTPGNIARDFLHPTQAIQANRNNPGHYKKEQEWAYCTLMFMKAWERCADTPGSPGWKKRFDQARKYYRAFSIRQPSSGDYDGVKPLYARLIPSVCQEVFDTKGGGWMGYCLAYVYAVFRRLVVKAGHEELLSKVAHDFGGMAGANGVLHTVCTHSVRSPREIPLTPGVVVTSEFGVGDGRPYGHIGIITSSEGNGIIADSVSQHNDLNAWFKCYYQGGKIAWGIPKYIADEGSEVRKKAVNWALNNYGASSGIKYSRERRNTRSNGTLYLDCSSYVCHAYHDGAHLSSVDVKYNTVSMRSNLVKKNFVWYPGPFTAKDLIPGDIPLDVDKHTCIYIGDGKVINHGGIPSYPVKTTLAAAEGGSHWDGFLRYEGKK